jgi:outer membrane cobalamin receptor
VAGTNGLDGYILADWSVEWRRELTRDTRVAVELTIENLFDRSYEVVYGFPGAGRGLGVSLRYEPR